MCSLSRLSAAPRCKQLRAEIRVYSFLKEFDSRIIRIDSRNIPLFDGVPEPDGAMREAYPDNMEELDGGFPVARGPKL